MQIYLNFVCKLFLIIVILAWVWLSTVACLGYSRRIVAVPVKQKILTHERRDLLVLFRASFLCQWFGCSTFKRGVALVHVTYCTIQIKCD